jgi:MFS family permease
VRRSALLAVCLAVFVDMLGFGIILPSLPLHAADLGGGGVWVGALLTVYAAAQFVAAPVLGALSDRYGRRRLLLLSLIGSAVSLTVTGVAGSLTLLLLARVVAGGFGGATAVGQAYVIDLSTPQHRTRALGLVGASIGLGFVFGPAIGAGLAGLGVDFAGTCFVAAGIAALNVILGLFLLPAPDALPAPVIRSTPRPAGRNTGRPSGAGRPSGRTAGSGRSPGAGRRAIPARAATGPAARARVGAPAGRTPGLGRLSILGRVNALRTGLGRPELRPVLLAMFAVTFAFVGMETTFALLARDRFGLGPAGLGVVFAGVGVVMVIVQGGLVGRLTDRYGDAPVAVTGAVLLGLGLVLLPFVPAGLGYPALGLLAVGQGLLSPTIAALIARNGGRHLGGLLGVGQSAAAAARAVGPLVAGIAFDLRPGVPYLLGAGLCAAAALLLRTAGRAAPETPTDAEIPADPDPELVGR